MLYNNGYIVKDMVENEELFINHGVYKGIQSCHNWPLGREKDIVSEELTKAADDHFEKNDYREIMRDTELLNRYVRHCKELKINVVVMKVMSSQNTFTADKDLEEIEELGYDCMAGDSVSYLTEVFSEEDGIEVYKRIKEKLNPNGLFYSYAEAEDFIKERKKLLEQGVNLEDYWEPVSVKLSTVVVE